MAELKGWIDINDRLPKTKQNEFGIKTSDPVFIYDDEFNFNKINIAILYFNSGKEVWASPDHEGTYFRRVTHWMELPERPRSIKK